MEVGQTVRVAVGSWSPHPVLHYQWYVNGHAIARATTATFRIPINDKGKRLTVRVRGARSGYRATTRLTKATVKIRPRT